MALSFVPCTTYAQLTPRTAAGDTPAAIAPTIADFKSVIGATDNGVGPAKTNGHRLITWDDVPDAMAAPKELERLLQDKARGISFEGGDVFQISMDDNAGNDPDPDEVRFDNLHPRMSEQVTANSEPRLFTTFGTRFDVRFTVPGVTTGGTVKGFGLVFLDVELANATSVEFFDRSYVSLGKFYALPGRFSFVGASSASPHEIAVVSIRHGNIAIFGTENSERDIVVMDDIMFGEPQPATFEITATRAIVTENPTSSIELVITRQGSWADQASVQLTAEGTAQSSDYMLEPAPVVFAPGEFKKTVLVPVVNDTLFEGLETVRFGLKNPTERHTIRAGTGVTVLIADDEFVAPTAYGTTFDNKLVAFRLDKPNTILWSYPISGLQPGESVVGLDFRPKDAVLFAVTSGNRVYRLAPGPPTLAYPVANGPFSPGPPPNTNFAVDIDFDARQDVLRLVNANAVSLRLNPDTGMVVNGTADTPLAYAAGDPHAGETPRLGGLAYTHSYPGAAQTVGYGVDLSTRTLVKVDASNPSVLTTVGPTGVDLTGAPMDIQQGTNFAFTIGQPPILRTIPYVFLIDLTTGRADAIGSYGTDAVPAPSLRTLTIVPSGVLRIAGPDRISVDEGGTAQVQVERVGGYAGELHADLRYAGGTATPATDMESSVFQNQTLVFADSVTTVNPVRLKTVDDTLMEGTEELNLALDSDARGFIGVPATTTLRIIDNDIPSISIDDVTLAEGNTGTTSAVFTVKLNRADAKTVTVKYATADDTAKAHKDYVPASGTVTFAPGVVTRTIELPVIGDNFPEGASERFRVKLSEPANAGFIDDEGIATITDSDTQPTYYLAEGATGPFFDTDILLANPHAAEAPVTLTFLKPDAAPIVQTMTLAPTSRTTVRVDDIAGLESTAVSTLVTSTSGLPIVVERTMRWDASGYGAHTERAVEGAAPTWYFAEGAQGFFSTYLLLANPNAAENTASVQYLREGEAPVTRTYTIAANARVTIDVSDDADLMNRSFGMIVTFAQPGVAERAMYFGSNPLWKAGHESAGVTTPSSTWFLAEGATGDFFETFVLMSNPQTVNAEVTLTFLITGGAPIVKTKTIPASGRLTVNIEAEDPALANVAVGTQVASSVPIIVERAQYWPFSPDRWYEAHNSFGITALGLKWGLAEGRTGGRDNYQTYVLLANPGASAADVTLTFLRTNGTTVTKAVTVPPASRFNVSTGPDTLVPELANEDFAVVIASTQPIAVERAMYLDAGGITWSAGTNATATRLP